MGALGKALAFLPWHHLPAQRGNLEAAYVRWEMAWECSLVFQQPARSRLWMLPPVWWKHGAWGQNQAPWLPQGCPRHSYHSRFSLFLATECSRGLRYLFEWLLWLMGRWHTMSRGMMITQRGKRSEVTLACLLLAMAGCFANLSECFPCLLGGPSGKNTLPLVSEGSIKHSTRTL